MKHTIPHILLCFVACLALSSCATTTPAPIVVPTSAPTSLSGDAPGDVQDVTVFTKAFVLDMTSMEDILPPMNVIFQHSTGFQFSLPKDKHSSCPTLSNVAFAIDAEGINLMANGKSVHFDIKYDEEITLPLSHIDASCSMSIILYMSQTPAALGHTYSGRST